MVTTRPNSHGAHCVHGHDCGCGPVHRRSLSPMWCADQETRTLVVAGNIRGNGLLHRQSRVSPGGTVARHERASAPFDRDRLLVHLRRPGGAWLHGWRVSCLLLAVLFLSACAATSAATGPTTLAQQNGEVWGLAFTPDGRTLASCSFEPLGADHAVRLWDMAKPGQPPVVEWRLPAGCRTVAISPDGNRVAAGAEDGIVRLWDMRHPEQAPLALSGHTSWINAVAFSPDGHLLASGSDDSSVRVWDLQNITGPPRVLSDSPSSIFSLAFAEDSHTLAGGNRYHTV